MKIFDFVTPSITLYHYQNGRHNNTFGRILWVIIYLLVFCFWIYFFLDLVNKTNPKSFIVQKFADDVGVVKLDNQSLFHYFSIKVAGVGKVLDYDPRLIQGTGRLFYTNGNNIAFYEYGACDPSVKSWIENLIPEPEFSKGVMYKVSV